MVFVKKIKSGSRIYYYLVRSYRVGKNVRQETIKRLTPEEANDPNYITNFLLMNPKYQTTDTKAIILAAGKSQRLFPHSQDLPKGLVPIENKPILQHLIDSLRDNGVNDFILITGFYEKKLKNHFKNEMKLLYNPFFSISSVLASLWFAYQEMDNSLLILYSDLLFDKTIIKNLLEDESDISIAVSSTESDGVTEKAIVENNLLIEIGRKVSTSIKRIDFAGIAKFSQEGAFYLQNTLDEMAREDEFLDYYFSDLLERLILKGHKITVKVIPSHLWIDINTPQDLQRAQSEIFKNIHTETQLNQI